MKNRSESIIQLNIVLSSQHLVAFIENVSAFCVCARGCIPRCVHKLVESRYLCWSSSVSLQSIFWERFCLDLELSPTGQSGWKVSSKDLGVWLPAGTVGVHYHSLAFYTPAGNLALRLHASVADILPTEPSPHL